jgi:hypothetical protein
MASLEKASPVRGLECCFRIAQERSEDNILLKAKGASANGSEWLLDSSGDPPFALLWVTGLVSRRRRSEVRQGQAPPYDPE